MVAVVGYGIIAQKRKFNCHYSKYKVKIYDKRKKIKAPIANCKTVLFLRVDFINNRRLFPYRRKSFPS